MKTETTNLDENDNYTKYERINEELKGEEKHNTFSERFSLFSGIFTWM